MKIEKKIYYCWFGKGEMSDQTKAYIADWAVKMPDYEIVEINETNFDIDAFAYAKTAYAAKRYAFVSDCARIFYLQTYGGIYLDTDVEIKKDLTPLLAQYESKVLLSQEYYQFELTGVNTSVIISDNNCKIWADLLKYYVTRDFVDVEEPETINQYISRLLADNTTFAYKDKEQLLSYKGDEIAVVPAKYLMLNSDAAFAVHHLAGTWKQGLSPLRKFRRVSGVVFKRIIGRSNFERLWNNKGK